MSDSQASQKSARSTAAKAVTDLSRGSPGFWRSLAFLLAATAVLVGTMVIDPNLTLVALPMMTIIFVLLERANHKTTPR
ncbi:MULTISPECIES: hypothetical protein [Alphaproteobacteria]|uniref:hypothetical protein n=1 Tax=Alphaproteobacteria TaxID=28211 RepID=UPI002603160B|nr:MULTISPECIES: hypothetical protein [Alphaproteobacteria]